MRLKCALCICHLTANYLVFAQMELKFKPMHNALSWVGWVNFWFIKWNPYKKHLNCMRYDVLSTSDLFNASPKALSTRIPTLFWWFGKVEVLLKVVWSVQYYSALMQGVNQYTNSAFLKKIIEITANQENTNENCIKY